MIFQKNHRLKNAEKDDEILVKDSSGSTKSIDLKPEIKKPDIKLVGKIDLEKSRQA